MLNVMKQQAADTIKQAVDSSIGIIGTIATWKIAVLAEVETLSTVETMTAIIVSGIVGFSTAAYMCSMVWLNIKKGKQLDKTGSTRFPQKPKPPANL